MLKSKFYLCDSKGLGCIKLNPVLIVYRCLYSVWTVSVEIGGAGFPSSLLSHSPWLHSAFPEMLDLASKNPAEVGQALVEDTSLKDSICLLSQVS